MKYIYILLILLVLFILVFLVTEDRCEIATSSKALEKFTQVRQNKFVCNDENAANHYTGELGENQMVDNSYCSYNNNIVCNRPFAENYDNSLDNINKNNTSNEISVCGNDKFSNYVDVFEYNEDGYKIRAIRSDASGTPLTYLGNEVIIDKSDTRGVDDNEKYLKYKTGNAIVYKQTNILDNSKCKYINNKICRFPMATTNINSLHGISKDDNEFKSLVNSNNELLPDKYLISGASFDENELLVRNNKKMLYKELFFETDSIAGYGLNLWDINGFVNMQQLTTSKDVIVNSEHTMNADTENELHGPILGSYINENGTINNRLGYGFSSIPRNYNELVAYARKNDFHVALAISKNADKYACGIGTTKAIACDIALVRCKTFTSFDNLEKYFTGLSNELQIELKRRRNVYPIKTVLGLNLGLGSITDSKIIDEDNEDDKNLQDIIKDYIEIKDELTLATSYYRLMSHKELYNRFLNDELDVDSEIIKKVEKTDPNITDLPSLNEIMNYITDKSKKDEINGNKCGILMVDNERYTNFNNDANIINSKCNPLPDVTNMCKDDNCVESTVIGVNDDNKCFILQDVKSIYPAWDKFNNDPVQKDGMEDEDFEKAVNQWSNEKEQINNNNKIDLANNLLDRCNSVGNNCILYKLNGEIYSYNSLFN